MKRLKLNSPVDRWDEAVPLGNGLIGVLLWGSGRKVKLSLDRGDLWDERDNGVRRDPRWNYKTLADAVARRDNRPCVELQELSNKMPATKLPVGRIELELESGIVDATYELDLLRALGMLCDRKGTEIISCFVDAESDMIYLKSSVPLHSIRIVPPDYQGKALLLDTAGTVKSVGSLGYAPGIQGMSGDVKYFLQPCAEGLNYGIFLYRVRRDGYVIRIVRSCDFEELKQIAEAGCPDIPGWCDAFHRHCAWWRRFWRRSRVALPDVRLQRYYELCRYFYGAASRPGAPPMPLQGVWTADDGSLPPWRGDFHHDLNTEFSYIAYLASGDFDCGECFFDYLTECLPKFRDFARDFYHCPGIAVPGVTSLAGEALGGWPQYGFSPMNGVWLATMFADHWRYTLDQDFLERKALPFCSGIAELLGALLKKDRDGFLKLPLSSSPEIHDMELEAFLTPNSNFDQALLLRFYADLAELADAAGKFPLAKKALQMRSRLAPLAVDPKEGLLIAPGELLKESHRHHSHLMGIWPLKLMNMEHDAATIANSLGRIDFLGTGQWVGYSFGWQAALNAWCGRGDRAIRLLNKFIDSFVSRNGFHLNGDFQDHGDSSFKYRPFTLEGNFVAMQAIHEMLLHAEAGVIRLFPALPEEWRKVSFEALRAPGGIRVSATLRGGVLLQAELFSPVEQDIWFSAPGVKEKRVRLSAGRAWHWFNRTAHPAGGTEDFAFDDYEDVSNG